MGISSDVFRDNSTYRLNILFPLQAKRLPSGPLHEPMNLYPFFIMHACPALYSLAACIDSSVRDCPCFVSLKTKYPALLPPHEIQSAFLIASSVFDLAHSSMSGGVGVGSPFIYHSKSEHPPKESISIKCTGNIINFMAVSYLCNTNFWIASQTGEGNIFAAATGALSGTATSDQASYI